MQRAHFNENIDKRGLFSLFNHFFYRIISFYMPFTVSFLSSLNKSKMTKISCIAGLWFWPAIRGCTLQPLDEICLFRVFRMFPKDFDDFDDESCSPPPPPSPHLLGYYNLILFFSFLLGSLRLDQRMDDLAEGWLHLLFS